MKHSTSLFLLVVCFGVAIPSFGQEPKSAVALSRSDPSGTWYGGSGDLSSPYQMTIVPIGVGRFSVRAQQAIAYAPLGIAGVTDWTGVMIKGSGRKYSVYLTAFYIGAEDPTLDMVVAHSVTELSEDGMTLRNTIDVFGAYLPCTPDKEPFVTPLDLDYLELFELGDTLEETYYRMPTTCRICPPRNY